MIKKAIACLLIALLAMTILAVQLASGEYHHKSGANYSWNTYQSNPSLYFPRYSECIHTTEPGASDNTEVGLGVRAYYVNQYYFGSAWWDFNAQYGLSDLAILGGLIIDPCVNGDDHHYYQYQGTPQWASPPAPPGWQGNPYYCYYLHYAIDPPSYGWPDGTPVNIGYKASVEGSTTAYFYHPSNPPWPPTFGPMWSLDAYTQNPYNPSDPNGWSYLHTWYT